MLQTAAVRAVVAQGSQSVAGQRSDLWHKCPVVPSDVPLLYRADAPHSGSCSQKV